MCQETWESYCLTLFLMFPNCHSTESMNANADFFVSVAVQSKLSVILSTPMCSNVNQ